MLQDGALSDAELNAFQVNCFSAPLQPEELSGVRKVVSESMPQVRHLHSTEMQLLKALIPLTYISLMVALTSLASEPAPTALELALTGITTSF